MFAVSMASRYLANPGSDHWHYVENILRYIKETINYGIKYVDLKLTGYTDSDFATNPDTRRSTSGYIFTLCGGPVSWMSQRQRIVALSTTVAEYIAVSDATKEAIWLRRLLQSVGEDEESILIFVDNQGTIKLIKNPEFHKRTKHIEVRYHFIRQKYEDGIINIQYVPSSDQLADILTKALPKETFQKHRTKMKMEDLVVAQYSTGGSVEEKLDTAQP